MPDILYSICSEEAAIIDLVEIHNSHELSQISASLPLPLSLASTQLLSSSLTMLHKNTFEDRSSDSDFTVEKIECYSSCNCSSDSNENSPSSSSFAIDDRARHLALQYDEVFNRERVKRRSSYIWNNTWQNIGLSRSTAGVPMKDFDREDGEVGKFRRVGSKICNKPVTSIET